MYIKKIRSKPHLKPVQNILSREEKEKEKEKINRDLG